MGARVAEKGAGEGGAEVADTRWLEKRRRLWYCVMDVPRVARPGMGGKRKLVRSLKTPDLTTARMLRHMVLADFHRQIREAMRGPVADELQEEAIRWREEAARLAATGEGSGVRHDVWNPDTGAFEEVEETQAALLHSLAMDRAAEIAATRASEVGAAQAGKLAKGWFDVATGKALPLSHFVDAWLAEGGRKGPVTAATARAYRRYVKSLEAWCSKESIPATVESIDGRTAGAFVGHLVLVTKERSSANNVILGLSAYWRWLVKRHHASANPWTGQSLGIPPEREDGKEERAFTKDELARLLGGGADQTLLDGMQVAALSGLRVEEMHQLRIQDCAAGVFRVTKGKSVASRRSVPIHPALAPIVARLSEGKASDAYLFPSKAKGWRADAMAARFLTYRRRLGVDDTSAGRRSLVNWHSFRRWFANAARAAGVAEDAIGACLGHEPATVTGRRYVQMQQEDLRPILRACVEAVCLPAPLASPPEDKSPAPAAPAA